MLKLTIVGTLLSLFLLQAGTVAAHAAGTMHLVSVPAGDFLLTVWTAPEPTRVGELHVIVGVAMAGDGAVVLDDDLRIEVTASSGLGEPLVDLATRAKSDNKFLYEANLIPLEAAWYQVRVNVSHPQRPGGEVTFNVDVLPQTGPNWLLIAVALLLSVGVAGAVLVGRRRYPGTVAAGPDR
jgi:LPXTG-motif cell wall-anchored protein